MRKLVLGLFLACLPVLAAQESAKHASHAQAPGDISGRLQDNVYRNSFFGFTYKLPIGWVDRTDDMRADAEPAPDDADKPRQAKPSAKSLVLLSTFERPPEATGETINSAVVIAAEPVSAYPGLMDAENYFGPLTELARSRSLDIVKPPYEFHIGTRLLMRGDFSKAVGKLTMYQSSLVMMQKSYVVSFTFIGGSEDEVGELVQGLSFDGSDKSTTSPRKP